MAGAPLALAPGAVIDNLRVDRVLGQGAFGVTYLVTDLVLDQSFALKEYLPRDQVSRIEDGRLQPLGQEAAQQFSAGLVHFLEEGRTAARFDHPNVVKVFRCFEANGTAYLLMPWYRGEALHRLLKRSGTFSAEEAVALAGSLLGALEYIHREGLVHQDIKPANIYIKEDGQPVLLDFGAAGQRLAEDESTRKRLGSEGYAAPEQSEQNGRIGPWTDIYGLAATLYRCISGKIPAAATRRLTAIRGGENDPLVPMEQMAPGPEFSAIAGAINRGLALESASRPQNIAEWRATFPLRTGGKNARGETLAEGIEQEGREWLPIILVSIFAVALLAAVVYLFVGDRPEQDDTSEVRTSRPEQAAPEERFETPEERARWQSALEADTPYGYQLFLHDYPDSVHREQAEMHLEQLDHQAWGYAVAQGTKTAIESYMDTFPGALHEADARIRLEEFRQAEEASRQAQLEEHRRDKEAWEEARSKRTIESLKAYLTERPDGIYSNEARAMGRQLVDERNDGLAFDAAKKMNRIEAYAAYIEAFPNGVHVARALQAIDDLTLRPGKTFKDCADCPTMVVVPAGSFWQGSEDSNPYALRMETPRRMVTFADSFAASIFEITMEQWDRCAADGACTTRPPDNGWGRGSRPVIMVSWNDAQEFILWLRGKTGQAYSLPSESQWEYLARAGEESDWIGGDPARICEYGNIAGSESGFKWEHSECSDPAAIETLPVGSFKPNAFGVYDAVGNVAEWTLDCMNLSYLDAPADGSAWGRGICNSRITRGGSWFTGSKEVRLPARFNLKNGDRNDFTGFRVVRKIDM